MMVSHTNCVSRTLVSFSGLKSRKIQHHFCIAWDELYYMKDVIIAFKIHELSFLTICCV